LSPPEGPRRETPALHFGALEWGLTALLAVIWGASFLFIRLGLETFGAGLVPVLRLAFGVLALASLPRSRVPIDRADWPRVAVLGIVWMAVPFLLFSLAERTVPTAITGMINGAVPLMSAAFGALWARATPSPRRAFALFLGLVGVSVVAIVAASESDRGSHAPTDVAGIVMLLIGIACYGFSANYAIPLQRRYGAFPVLLRAEIVALVVSVPYGLFAARTASFSWGALGCMFLLGAFGTGLAYAVLAILVGRTDSTRGTIGIFLTPIVATLLGVTVRHEHLPAAVFFGSGLVLTGAFLTSRPEPTREA
jgi:drug/metabolite transporter (DMT)-like permease